MEKKAEVFVRIGTHAEKEYFEQLRHDGVIIGANLVEATPSATASLVIRLAGHKRNISYLIDPMTYAFGTYTDHDGVVKSDLEWIKSEQKRGDKIGLEFKRSYRALADAFGGVFQKALTDSQAIDWGKLSDPQLADVCRTVIMYQGDRIRQVFASEPGYEGYADRVPPPTVKLAPYFYIDQDWEHALEMNIELARRTARIEKGAHAVLCARADLLDNARFLRAAADGLIGCGVSGVWLWISAFQEDKDPASRLTAFRELVYELARSLDVNNMHGGYFSLLLCKLGMHIVSHGVGYGEQKDVIPVIGQSTPSVRYYLPSVHKRLGVTQIERAFDSLGVATASDFFRVICDCAVCKKVLLNDVSLFSEFGDLHYSTPMSKRQAQTPAAARRCRLHFLIKRRREKDHVNQTDLPQLVEDLKREYQVWNGQPSVGPDCQHIPRWIQAVS